MRSIWMLLALAGLAAGKRGTNLPENGGFEQALEGWRVNATSGRIRVSARVTS